MGSEVVNPCPERIYMVEIKDSGKGRQALSTTEFDTVLVVVANKSIYIDGRILYWTGTTLQGQREKESTHPYPYVTILPVYCFGSGQTSDELVQGYG